VHKDDRQAKHAHDRLDEAVISANRATTYSHDDDDDGSGDSSKQEERGKDDVKLISADNHENRHYLTIHSMEFSILSETFRGGHEKNNNKSCENEIAPIVLAQFHVKGPRFRMHMVRRLIGYCVDVARRRQKGGIEEGLAPFSARQLWSGAEDIAQQIHAAPASGLCLEHIEYCNYTTE
jgi:hypothetical protein